MRRADTLARQHTDVAIATLAEVMNDPFADNKDRLKAAESLLDRGHGKPLSAVIQIPPSKMQAQLLAAMSDDELLTVVNDARLPSMFGADDPNIADGELLQIAPPALDPLLA